MMQRLRSYTTLARRALIMARGTSYWHMNQPVGQFFAPGTLAGYFNDLTAKTSWDGPTDTAGIPMQPAANNAPGYFPITVFQKALGHWDHALDRSAADVPHDHMAQFRAICEWGRDQQDARGGWPIWFMRENPRFRSVYSAMAQGQGASVMCRMYQVSRDRAWLDVARRALDLMLTPIGEGGMAHLTDHGLVLEEYPAHPLMTVLNGWIFALYGLYDFQLIADEARFQAALAETVDALAAHLPSYDLGFWSRYTDDYAGGGLIASPFYHALHIAQLQALYQTFPDHTFGMMRKRFARYAVTPRNRARAVVMKVWEKVVKPPEVIFR